MMVPDANVDCPTCGGRLEYVGGDAFECVRCSGLLEQSPSGGRAAVEAALAATLGRDEP